VSIPGSRVELIASIDHVAQTAGDPKIWLKITNAFRLSKDRGGSFAPPASLEEGPLDKWSFSAPLSKMGH
jgi:hypothetical protein